MTPSFIGRYATISSGVRPTISLASFPTARILLSLTETATTDGSFKTIPFPGTKTNTVVVPRSMPSFGENQLMEWEYCTPLSHRGNYGNYFAYFPTIRSITFVVDFPAASGARDTRPANSR